MEAAEITRKFVEALNNKFQGKKTPLGVIEFATAAGGRHRSQNFDKIILPKWVSSPDGSIAHAFVERSTGKLYRAANWTQPVVDARYDLSNKIEFMLAVELADPYGNYLRRNYNRSASKEYLVPAGR